MQSSIDNAQSEDDINDEVKIFQNALDFSGPLDNVSVSPNIWCPPFVLRQTNPAMAPKKVTLKATTSIDDATKAALLAEKKGKVALVGDVPHEAL